MAKEMINDPRPINPKKRDGQRVLGLLALKSLMAKEMINNPRLISLKKSDGQRDDLVKIVKADVLSSKLFKFLESVNWFKRYQDFCVIGSKLFTFSKSVKWFKRYQCFCILGSKLFKFSKSVKQFKSCQKLSRLMF